MSFFRTFGVPSLLMTVLVLSLTALTARFAKRYLHGEAHVQRFYRQLALTALWVLAFIASDNLVAIAVSWALVSFAVQPMLRFYEERPEARIAAHKKFLLSRFADALMVVSLLLFKSELGTLQLSELAEAMDASAVPTPMVSLAGCLLVLAVIVRSAQLPFHGWLIQVMEAPTPVSALLHAGVVSLGGFLLIRMGPVFGRLPLAQLTLVVWGTVAATLASLAMTTRISVRVALAWSTCAQMGFMLIECGLGAYHLAMLHLLAHSFYKAYAFLSCGRTVERTIVHSTVRAPLLRPSHQVQGLLWSGVIAFSIASIAFDGMPRAHVVIFMALAAIAAAPLFAHGLGAVRNVMMGTAALTLVAVTDYLAHMLVPSVPPIGWFGMIPVLAMLLLWVLRVWLAASPMHAIARRVHAAAFAGFYLDEAFTRVALKLVLPNARRPMMLTLSRLRNL